MRIEINQWLQSMVGELLIKETLRRHPEAKGPITILGSEFDAYVHYKLASEPGMPPHGRIEFFSGAEVMRVIINAADEE